MEALGRRSVAWGIKRVFDVLWYLLLLATVLVLLGTIVNAARGESEKSKIDFGVNLRPHEGALALSSSRLGIEQGELRNVKGQIRFASPGGMYSFAYMSPAILLLAIALVIIHQLRAVFGTLVEKAPFVRANARRIRLIGIVAMAGQVAGSLISLALSRHMNSVFETRGFEIVPSSNFNPFIILFGLILVVIAEVFRLGAEMKEEQDLTV